MPEQADLNEATESAAVQRLLLGLDRAVAIRVRDERCVEEAGELNVEVTPSARSARIGLLFSGGLDSIVLAILSHRHVPAQEPIDLLNVAFSNLNKQPASGDIYDVPESYHGRRRPCGTAPSCSTTRLASCKNRCPRAGTVDGAAP